MMAAMDKGADLSSLRAAVSAGETLPAPVYDEWMEKTGKPMLDGIGATEMLHIFHHAAAHIIDKRQIMLMRQVCQLFNRNLFSKTDNPIVATVNL